MAKFIPWNSQPLDDWSMKYARGKFVKLDGLKTHYIEAGEGDPVIMIHGYFYDTHSWDGNFQALAKHYRVFALDLWGFGYSTRQDLDFGYPLYARQLDLFMDAMGLEKAALIGQSMGGGTIVSYAVNHGPERVDKAVLVDPAILPNKLPLMGKIGNLPLVGELMFGMNSDFLRKKTLGNTFIHNREHITPAYFEKVTRFHKVENSTAIMLKILRKQFFHTLDEEIEQYARLDIPTMIVAGRQSAGIPIKLSIRVHDIVKGSRLEIYDQAGHCPHDEHPERFNQDVLDFLGS